MKQFQSVAVGVAVGAFMLFVVPPLLLLLLGADDVISAGDLWLNLELHVVSGASLALMTVFALKTKGSLLRRVVLPAALATAFWVLLGSAVSALGQSSVPDFIEAFFYSMALGTVIGTPVLVFAAFLVSCWLMVRNQADTTVSPARRSNSYEYDEDF